MKRGLVCLLALIAGTISLGCAGSIPRPIVYVQVGRATTDAFHFITGNNEAVSGEAFQEGVLISEQVTANVDARLPEGTIVFVDGREYAAEEFNLPSGANTSGNSLWIRPNKTSRYYRFKYRVYSVSGGDVRWQERNLSINARRRDTGIRIPLTNRDYDWAIIFHLDGSVEVRS